MWKKTTFLSALNLDMINSLKLSDNFIDIAELDLIFMELLVEELLNSWIKKQMKLNMDTC